MAVRSFEYVTIQGDYVTADLLIWRRYRMRTRGMVEMLIDLNPHLAKIHKTTPFIPVGTQVRIPIDLDLLKGYPKPVKTVTVFGTVEPSDG